MKKITLLFLATMVSAISWSQCIVGTSFGSETTPNDGTVTGISTCTYAGEYNTISNVIIGDDYTFTNTEGGVDNYVTITDATDTVIAHGMSPLTVTAITADTVRLHVTVDAACTTDSTCHTTTVQNLTVAANSCVDPIGLTAANLTDVSADISWSAGGVSEVDYNVEVYLTGESAAGGNAPVFANANVAATMITATGLAESVTYDVYITAACSGTTANSNLVGPVTFTTTASCSEVSNIAVANITANGLDISWTLGTGNDSALVEVYNAGESAAGANAAVYSNATATGGMDTASGLLSNTPYDVYVSGQCGATVTAVQGPVSFTTACDAIVAPYTEDFETFTVATTAFASENCWSGTGGAYFWELAAGTDTSSGDTGPAPSVTTGNYLFTEASAGGTGDVAEINAPLVDLTPLTTPALSFSYHMYGAVMGNLDVLVNGTVEFTLAGQQQTAETDPFVTAFVDLSAYAGQTVQVVFRATSGGTWEGDMAIDNVSFAEAPSCFTPSSVTNTALSDVSSTFTWAVGGSETTWEYENLPSPSTEPASGTSTTAMTATFSSLTPSTAYDFYVRSDCGGGTYSDWVKVTYSTIATPPANDDCAGVIDLGTLTSPLMSTTTDATNNFNVDCLTNASAPDIIYSILVPDGSTLNIGQTENGYDSKHRLAYGATCPGDVLIDCVDDPDIGNIEWVNTTGSDQTVYWIQSAFSTGSGTFTLEWSVVACTPSVATATVVEDCDVSGGFNIVVEVTDLGSATSLTISDDQGSVSQTANNVGTFTFGPYVNATDVSITTVNDQDNNCTETFANLTQAACPPANDACAGAAVISDFSNGDMQDASGATNNDGFIAVTGCGSANDGVWYTFEVVDAGNITVAITDVVGWDPEITVLAGGCDAFTCVTNADSAGTGGAETASFTATANTQYWVNIGYWSGSTDNPEGPFTINLTTTDTATLGTGLSVDEFQKESLFSYYPNPVNDNLTLNAQKEISNVSVYNMIGQEVYRNAPNSVNNSVDMSNLQSGAYFVKVTVDNVTETIKVIKN